MEEKNVSAPDSRKQRAREEPPVCSHCLSNKWINPLTRSRPHKLIILPLNSPPFVLGDTSGLNCNRSYLCSLPWAGVGGNGGGWEWKEAEEYKKEPGLCATRTVNPGRQGTPDPCFYLPDMKNPFLTAPTLPDHGVGMAFKETLACHILGKPSSIFD